jgi:hypothetical protein
MYLLDPDAGRRRREQMLAQAEPYRRWTDDLLDQTRRTLGQQTRGLSQQAHTLGEQTRGLLGHVRLPFGSTSNPQNILLERAAQAARPQSLLLLSCVGLGVGLMYLFDPGLGRRRRALISDKVRSYWRSTEGFIEKTARDVSNRTRGLVAEASTPLKGAETPDNAVLEARVRAQIGHLTPLASALNVSAEQGRITLRGSIPSSVADTLLSAIQSVSGVTEVVNQLELTPEAARAAGATQRQ